MKLFSIVLLLTTIFFTNPSVCDLEENPVFITCDGETREHQSPQHITVTKNKQPQADFHNIQTMEQLMSDFTPDDVVVVKSEDGKGVYFLPGQKIKVVFFCFCLYCIVLFLSFLEFFKGVIPLYQN